MADVKDQAGALSDFLEELADELGRGGGEAGGSNDRPGDTGIVDGDNPGGHDTGGPDAGGGPTTGPETKEEGADPAAAEEEAPKPAILSPDTVDYVETGFSQEVATMFFGFLSTIKMGVIGTNIPDTRVIDNVEWVIQPSGNNIEIIRREGERQFDSHREKEERLSHERNAVASRVRFLEACRENRVKEIAEYERVKMVDRLPSTQEGLSQIDLDLAAAMGKLCDIESEIQRVRSSYPDVVTEVWTVNPDDNAIIVLQAVDYKKHEVTAKLPPPV